MEADEIKSVTENLYRQGRELAVRNTTFSLLSKLYDISLLALSPKELAEKIARAVQLEFAFELVGIFNYGQKKDELVSLALAESSRFQAAEKGSTFFGETLLIENASKNPFFHEILSKNEMGYTENLTEIWGENISADRIKKLEEEGHVRSSLAYPLVSEEKNIGIFIIQLNRGYDKLASYEKDSLNNITNVVAIALDKAILYQKLQMTNAELAQANDRQEGLIHFISHQIKGYLTKSEAAFAGLVEGDYGEITETVQTLAKTALADNQQGVETVISILSAANLKKGTVAYNKKAFNFKEIVEKQVADKKKDAETRGLSLDLEIQSNENYEIVGDREQLEKHVIGNILDNSVKYTLKGSLKVKLGKTNGKILLSVTDTGVGINDEDKKRLFTEGGRGKDSVKVNVNSTGYGLYIAKQIVEAHGGRIWAESEGPNKGSTFFVELPTI